MAINKQQQICDIDNCYKKYRSLPKNLYQIEFYELVKNIKIY
ncbi:hypothetical protein [Spiroplasma endosymbiont of Polydrusus cervinus]